MDSWTYRSRTRTLVRPVFESSWFSRLWVEQEFNLVHGALFCWGTAQILTSTLTTAAIYGNVEWFWNLRNNRLPRLLRSTRGLSCADDRDRIHGILGLCDESDPLCKAVAGVLPNYGQSVEELFTDIACLFVEHASCFHLLTQVDVPRSKAVGLPSWVPDWRLPTPCRSFLYLVNGEPDSSVSLQPSLAVVDRTARVLSMPGVELDTLSAFTLRALDTDDVPTKLLVMAVVWIKPMATTPCSSFRHRELALFRVLGMADPQISLALESLILQGKSRPILPSPTDGIGRYLNGRDAFVSGLRMASSPAVRAMTRSVLHSANEVHDEDPRYFQQQPHVSSDEWKGRKLFLSRGSLLGVGPAELEAGDELVLFCEQGSPFLGIVRQDGGIQRFVGTAFVPTLYENGANDRM